MTAISNKYACPSCGAADHIEILISAWAKFSARPDGHPVTDAEAVEDQTHYWGHADPAACRKCGATGFLVDFMPVGTGIIERENPLRRKEGARETARRCAVIADEACRDEFGFPQGLPGEAIRRAFGLTRRPED